MTRFTVSAEFSQVKYPFHVYVGEPAEGDHPLRFQTAWLEEVRGGKVPQDVAEAFGLMPKIMAEYKVSFEEVCRLQAIAMENKVSFKDLCTYTLNKDES